MHLGIVTPHSLLHKFMIAVKDNDDVEVVPLIYRSIAEAASLVKQSQDKVSALFFAGASPYFLSLMSVERIIPWFYLDLPTGGILSALLQAREYLKEEIAFSVDSIEEFAIRQVLYEAKLDAAAILAYPYSPSPEFEEELVMFHARCFQDKKVRFCLTCHDLTQIKLTSLGIPAFYISPTIHSMRDSIELNISYVKERSSNHLRTVVGFYSIENAETLGGDIDRVAEYILNFGRKNNMLALQKTRTLFQMLLNYGQFLLITKGFSKSFLMEDLKRIFPDLRLKTGYGLSPVTSTAEDWARKALEMSVLDADNHCYLFDGKEYCRIGEKHSYKITEQERDLAQKMQVTEGTLLRYMRILRSMEKTFSAKEFANAAGIHTKASRKILNRFFNEGVLEPNGKRPAVTRGRPEILYSAPNLRELAG
ncbi:hypothetical protein AGMMS49957_08240 [Synergistales bacterium]|nr:hypothetical protein AGMMS49957_08240 [Synergistales bacterium]